jgi:hypothetical protein
MRVFRTAPASGLFLLLVLGAGPLACSSAGGGGDSDDGGLDDTGGSANDAPPGDDTGGGIDAPPGTDTAVPKTDSAGIDTTPPPDPPPIPGAVYGAKCTGMNANELTAWEEIAVIRGKAKMAALDCIDPIQTAARNHSHYSELNGWVLTHQETAGKPGFTGVQFWDRMKAAGFTGPGYAMFEVAHSTGNAHASVLGESGWINTLYHRIPFVSYGAKSYGYGGAGTGYPGSSTIDFGSGGTIPAAKTISTWPVDGDTNVWTTFKCGSEIPNPLPGKSVAGYPVSITGGGTLDITTHTLTDPAGTELAHVFITYKNDPYSATSPLVPKDQAYLITSSVLKPSTKYVAHFAGTSGGQPIDVTISFTTGTK